MIRVLRNGFAALAMLASNLSGALANDYSCILGARIPMTIAAAQASKWKCTTTCAEQLDPNATLLPDEAEIFSRDNRDKEWGPPYKRGEICIVYVDPGKTTRARYGDGARCFHVYTANPAGPCQPNDPILASDKAVVK